jgi:hypothetical protein
VTSRARTAALVLHPQENLHRGRKAPIRGRRGRWAVVEPVRIDFNMNEREVACLERGKEVVDKCEVKRIAIKLEDLERAGRNPRDVRSQRLLLADFRPRTDSPSPCRCGARRLTRKATRKVSPGRVLPVKSIIRRLDWLRTAVNFVIIHGTALQTRRGCVNVDRMSYRKCDDLPGTGSEVRGVSDAMLVGRRAGPGRISRTLCGDNSSKCGDSAIYFPMRPSDTFPKLHPFRLILQNLIAGMLDRK